MKAIHCRLLSKISPYLLITLFTLSIIFVFAGGEARLASPPVPYQVKDIYPGDWSSELHEMQEVNGTLFFSTLDDISGFELWRSDGTQEGTFLVKDFNPGIDS